MTEEYYLETRNTNTPTLRATARLMRTTAQPGTPDTRSLLSLAHTGAWTCSTSVQKTGLKYN